MIQCFRIVLFVCGLVKIHTIELKLFSDVFDLFVYKLTKKKERKKKKKKERKGMRVQGDRCPRFVKVDVGYSSAFNFSNSLYD